MRIIDDLRELRIDRHHPDQLEDALARLKWDENDLIRLQDRINKAISGLDDVIGEKPAVKETKSDDVFKKMPETAEG
jgi:predicted HNH restriction endonuclease